MHEEDFRKPSLEEVWSIIASEISKEKKTLIVYIQLHNVSKSGGILLKCLGTQLNSKSGNEPKEWCPYFHELQDCYDYRPNVTPLYVGSSIKSPPTQSSSVETEEDKDVEQKIQQSSKKAKVRDL